MGGDDAACCGTGRWVKWTDDISCGRFAMPVALQPFLSTAVNLGQGFPDWKTPLFVQKALTDAITGGANQYCRSAGHPALVEHLANFYSEKLNAQITDESYVSVDPMQNVAVTVGASQALFAALQAFVSPGDEVILLEPAFDIYAEQVKMAGGTVVPVQLEPASKAACSSPLAAQRFTLNADRLKAAMSPRTAVVVLNTPHNPSGKVFTHAELEEIAAVVREHPHAVVINDEVYEHMVLRRNKVLKPSAFAGPQNVHEFPLSQDGVPVASHRRFAALPGMWERTVTISSMGKLLVCTGWKVGWAYGDAPLLKRIHALNQWQHFCVSTPAQVAAASALATAAQRYDPTRDNDSVPDPFHEETASGHEMLHFPYTQSPAAHETHDEYSYFQHVQCQYEYKRQLLIDALSAGGIQPVLPDSGIFIMGDTSALDLPDKYRQPTSPAHPAGMSRDWAVVRRLAHEAGIVAIPPSAFHSADTAHASEQYIRFSFGKQNEQLHLAHRRFAAFHAAAAAPSQ